jgi:hypothetical protein
MRDFLEYVERTKQGSPGALDYYMENFVSNLSQLGGVDPSHTFIVGYLIGKGVDIDINRPKIINLLKANEIQSVQDAITSLELDENTANTIKSLRDDLTTQLTKLRTLLTTLKKEDEKKEDEKKEGMKNYPKFKTRQTYDLNKERHIPNEPMNNKSYLRTAELNY